MAFDEFAFTNARGRHVYSRLMSEKYAASGQEILPHFSRGYCHAFSPLAVEAAVIGVLP